MKNKHTVGPLSPKEMRRMNYLLDLATYGKSDDAKLREMWRLEARERQGSAQAFNMYSALKNWVALSENIDAGVPNCVTEALRKVEGRKP